MALATLSIDLEARLAGLQQGFDRAARIAEQNSQRLQASFAKVGASVTALAGSLAGAFSAGAVVRFVSETVKGIDALNDFADAVGTSVENASALEDVALRTGTSLQTVTDAALKLNKVLSDAKPGSDQERALQAIGLAAKDLRELDPADALLQVAKALAQYADDGNKARLIQELFGKSTREVAPLLKDLAEKGQLVATVTSQQAAETEKFNRQLDNLGKNLTDVARAITGPFLPALNRMFDEIRAADTLPDLGKRLVQWTYPGIAIRGATALVDMARSRGAGGAEGSWEDPRDVLRRLEASYRPSVQLPLPAEPDKKRTGPARTPREDPLSALRSAVEQYKADFLRSEREAYDSIAEFLDEQAEAARRLQESLSAITDPREQYKSDFLRSEKNYEEVDQAIKRLAEQAERTTRIGEELGLTFASAFEDAIVGGRGLGEVLRGLEQDVIRLVTRLTVTEPLAEFLAGQIKDVGGGGDFFSGIFSKIGSLFSGFFADGGFIPPGRWGVVGERGAEAVYGGRTGVSVVPAAAGMQVVQHFHLAAPADLRTQQQIAAAAARGLQRAAARNN